jgi:LacI family gluconate utilization system Gnt-I transcriptional repressor
MPRRMAFPLAAARPLTEDPGMGKKLLLRDVAQAAGVSEMTASRALRGAPDVSERTREKVRSIAAEIGYVPNRIAGSLASKSVNLIGVVIPSLSSSVFAEVLRGLSQSLSSSPLKPVIGVSGYDLQEEEEVVREMLSWQPSGLVVTGLEHSETTRRMLENAGCPVVEIMDIDGTPVSHCVGISHHQAGRDMARTILQQGYEKIGFIGSKLPQDTRADKRLAGFRECLEQSGKALHDFEAWSDVSSIETGRNLTARMLERSPDLDCLYYSSDVLAVGGYMHCLASNLSVPGDLALAGFNDLELLRGLPLTLATTDAHRFEIGETAARIILDAREEESAGEARVIRLEPEIRRGQSL